MKVVFLAILIFVFFHPTHHNIIEGVGKPYKSFSDIKTLETQKELQTPVEPVVVANVDPPTIPPTIQSDDYYMQYIFAHEGAIDSINSIGCKGEGQDCNGRLVIDCPNWATDKPCQDAFFTRYMIARYGSWLVAYEFKVRTGWW